MFLLTTPGLPFQMNKIICIFIENLPLMINNNSKNKFFNLLFQTKVSLNSSIESKKKKKNKKIYNVLDILCDQFENS